MGSVWFSKKRCAEMLASGLRPFLVKGDAGDIVAATFIGEPDAAQKKKYPDYVRILEGKALLCLSASKSLTRSGQEYARTQGIPATYDAVFDRTINKAMVMAAASPPPPRREPGGETALLGVFKTLRAKWIAANPDVCYPTDDIQLKEKTGWQYVPPGKKDFKITI